LEIKRKQEEKNREKLLLLQYLLYGFPFNTLFSITTATKYKKIMAVLFNYTATLVEQEKPPRTAAGT
jgi:hypothetical protein